MPVIAVVLFFSFQSRTTAFLITALVKLLAGKAFKKLQISGISIFSLEIEGLDIIFRSTRKLPEACVSWKRVKLIIQWSRILDPFVAGTAQSKNNVFGSETVAAQASGTYSVKKDIEPVIILEILSMQVSSPSAQLKNFLDPSDKKMATRKSRKRSTSLIETFTMNTMRHFMQFFAIRMIDFSFEFKMPIHDCIIQGTR